MLVNVFCALFITSFPAAVLAFSGKTIKLMPLGASITFGSGSSQGNGYRDDLYNLLERDGNKVDFVGSHRGGTFKDPDNEGWPGMKVYEVLAKAKERLPKYKPNIVTLLVGTNDMRTGEIGVNAAAKNLSILLDNILNRPELTCIIVSTLPPNVDSKANANIDKYNAKIPGIVKQKTDAGRWVVLVDSHSVIKVGDLKDGTHPNDKGYEKMARVFYNGIQAAEKKGWISTPGAAQQKKVARAFGVKKNVVRAT